ncbi:hypothetical protein PIB30_040563 [Stylosanthes scabra]|uniref:SET domain-containing protein n=1 Tax=Stylosanthes scabra TaxID=79078 RepID=A0ABU6WHH6_9FABA|nr:hypothetical protein [Stylosanthes scabra]
MRLIPAELAEDVTGGFLGGFIGGISPSPPSLRLRRPQCRAIVVCLQPAIVSAVYRPSSWEQRRPQTPASSPSARDPSHHHCDVAASITTVQLFITFKRLAYMVISGVATSDILDILQPANLTSQMISRMEEEYGLLKNAFKKTFISDEHVAWLYEDFLSSTAASVKLKLPWDTLSTYFCPSTIMIVFNLNAHIIWIDNADAKLKALGNVDEGEEHRICYIDASLNRDARQELLSRGFGFQCNCNRCLHGD